jgi:hypothetical protein
MMLDHRGTAASIEQHKSNGLFGFQVNFKATHFTKHEVPCDCESRQPNSCARNI